MDRKMVVFVGTSISAAICGVFIKAVGAPPNIEGLMPFVLAFGMVAGPLYGFVNGLLARALYDGYMGWAGWWTLFTSIAYGIVGLCAAIVGMAKRRWNRLEIGVLAAALTIVYDVLTMLVFGLAFKVPIDVLLIGQIPFTINHLVGNVTFCVIFTPFLVNALDGYLATKSVAKYISPAE